MHRRWMYRRPITTALMLLFLQTTQTACSSDPPADPLSGSSADPGQNEAGWTVMAALQPRHGSSGVALGLPQTVPAGTRERFMAAARLAEQGDLDAAIAAYTTLVHDFPGSPEALNNLAALYAGRGDAERAREMLYRAMDTHPTFALVHQNLSEIYALEAARAYSRLLGERPPGDHLALAMIEPTQVAMLESSPMLVMAGAEALDTAPGALDGTSQETARASQESAPEGNTAAALVTPTETLAAAPGETAPVTLAGEPQEAASETVDEALEGTPPETQETAAAEASLAAPAAPAAPATPPTSPETTATPETPVTPPIEVLAGQVQERVGQETAGQETAGQETAGQETVGVRPETVGNESAEEAVLQAVLSWAEAWSLRDTDRYLQAYSGRFQPDGGLTRAQWVSQRRARLSAPQFIEVGISDLSITVDGSQASALFDQDYRSDRLNSRVRKRLDLHYDGQWKITQERVLR